MKKRLRFLFALFLITLWYGGGWYIARVDIFFSTGASVVGQEDYLAATGPGFAMLVMAIWLTSLAYRKTAVFFALAPSLRAVLFAPLLALLVPPFSSFALKTLGIIFAQKALPLQLTHPFVLLFTSFLLTSSFESFFVQDELKAKKTEKQIDLAGAEKK